MNDNLLNDIIIVPLGIYGKKQLIKIKSIERKMNENSVFNVKYKVRINDSLKELLHTTESVIERKKIEILTTKEIFNINDFIECYTLKKVYIIADSSEEIVKEFFKYIDKDFLYQSFLFVKRYDKSIDFKEIKNIYEIDDNISFYREFISLLKGNDNSLVRKMIDTNIETREIIKDLSNEYCINKNVDVIEKYVTYIRLRKEKKISLGNYNILINNISKFGFEKKLLEYICKLLKANSIINTEYTIIEYFPYIDIGDIERVESEVVVIDMQKEMVMTDNRKDELNFIFSNVKEKIIILLCNRDIQKNDFNNITWNMNIDEITKDEKIKYIKLHMQKSNIMVNSRSKFINDLANEPFDLLTDRLFKIILECKINNIHELNSKSIKKIHNVIKIEKNIHQSAMSKLDSMIGVKEVKTQITQILNYIKINKKRGDMPSLHMCFCGNPGTGKTTVARIIGEIFKENNILSNDGKFVEAQRADLIAEYVGQTAPKTKRVINKAQGGVLFIDEAYSIASYVKDEAGIDYGTECVSTLIKEMEDKRDSICVILAGYTDEMTKMLKTNPGFESRIQFKINFPDYSEEELYSIFKGLVKKEKYSLSNNVKQILIEIFSIEKQKKNFSNARFVRNLFEKIKFEQVSRVIANIGEDVNLIKKCDVEMAIEKMHIESEKVKNRIGFKI